MSEDRFIELITKELTSEITADELRELNTLVGLNLILAKQRSRFRMFWASGNTDRSDHDTLFAKITTRIQEHEPAFNAGNSVVKTKLWPLIWKMSAAVFLIAGSYLSYKQYALKDKIKRDLLSTLTHNGERKKITLVDGTIVSMNAGSKLLYPSSFGDSTRDVYLTGEAFFDVHKDHKHPFIIHTRKMNIRVLGTAFNVKAYPDDRFTETTLIRGVIQVTLADRPSDRITLKPTEKLIVKYSPSHMEGSRVIAEKANALPEVTYLQKRDTTVIETAWLQNKLIFKNQDFYTLAKSLERRYSVEIDFNNEANKQLRFSGIFEKESITEALNALKLTEDFNYKTLSNNKILIY